MFWGVTDSQTIANYSANVHGEWDAVPRMLETFRRFQVRATWATVGMAMCRDFAHWSSVRPAIMPGYVREGCSNYRMESLVREYPKLFFARPLVEQIRQTPGQEIGSHTYSHFYCREAGASLAAFASDLATARDVAGEMGIELRSLVFPRNQAREEFIDQLPGLGFRVFRGNPDHWLYRTGHRTPAGKGGRAVRLADHWLGLSGNHVARPIREGALLNLPASMFLRPWSRATAGLESLRLARLKRAMTAAARAEGVFHLWWHPHNFGVNLDRNIAVLEELLTHFRLLSDQYGMVSANMEDFVRGDAA